MAFQGNLAALDNERICGKWWQLGIEQECKERETNAILMLAMLA